MWPPISANLKLKNNLVSFLGKVFLMATLHELLTLFYAPSKVIHLFYLCWRHSCRVVYMSCYPDLQIQFPILKDCGVFNVHLRDGELCDASPCLRRANLTVYCRFRNWTQTRRLKGKCVTAAPSCRMYLFMCMMHKYMSLAWRGTDLMYERFFFFFFTMLVPRFICLTWWIFYALKGDNDGVCDAVAKGLLDSYLVKQSAIKLATSTATTILQIDQVNQIQ